MKSKHILIAVVVIGLVLFIVFSNQKKQPQTKKEKKQPASPSVVPHPALAEALQSTTMPVVVKPAEPMVYKTALVRDSIPRNPVPDVRIVKAPETINKTNKDVTPIVNVLKKVKTGTGSNKKGVFNNIEDIFREKKQAQAVSTGGMVVYSGGDPWKYMPSV